MEYVCEIMNDVIYFGIMLVYNCYVDGMVLGVVYIMVYIVCLVLEIIKIVLGIFIVFSIFLMCLLDWVLVYGDCVIILNLMVE